MRDSPISLGDRTVRGAFFTFSSDPPARTPFVARRTAADGPYRHCLTYVGGGSSIERELIEMLDGAREKVFVATLYLGDAGVREALLRAAERLRGGVYVVAAFDDKGLDQALNETDDLVDVDRQIEYRNFKEITTKGVYVRGFTGLHAKYVVVDDEIALVSSANLGTRAFRQTGENGVVVTGRAHVLPIARHFARLWAQSSYDMPPQRDDHPVLDRTPSAAPALARPTGNGPVWTWAPERTLLDAAQELIASAARELVLATFSIVGMSRPTRRPAQPELLFDPVRRAIDRGVEVHLLMRGRNNGDASRGEAAAFADAGATVVADRYTHAKGVIADGCRGALFSANFVAHKGLTGGLELGMRIDGSAALTEARRYFQHVMAETDLQLVRDPRLADLARTLYADSFQHWPAARTIEVSARPGDWERLSGQDGVALYETAASGSFTLHSGPDRWSLAAAGEDGPWTLRRLGDAVNVVDAAATLEDWLWKRPGKGVRRGLCPATLVRADH